MIQLVELFTTEFSEMLAKIFKNKNLNVQMTQMLQQAVRYFQNNYTAVADQWSGEWDGWTQKVAMLFEGIDERSDNVRHTSKNIAADQFSGIWREVLPLLYFFFHF